MSFFSYLLFKCLILSSVWYGSHHYSYSMFFPPYFLSFAHRLVFSHLIKCMSPLLFVLLPLVITLPRGTGEVTVHQHPLSACGVLMYACEGKCLHGWCASLPSVHKAQANREGKRYVACAAGTLQVYAREGGGGGKLSWWRRVSREGGSVWHSTHNAAQRQRERLKLLVVR